MDTPALTPKQVRASEDVFEDEPESSSLISGIIYWGVLALGFAVPIMGAFWGAVR